MIHRRSGAACGACVALLLACSSEGAAPPSAEPLGSETSALAERRGCDCPRVPVCNGACDSACVEAGRYLALGPIVIDMHEAGRIWQRADAPRLLDHAQAVAYCTQLSRGCYASGWRLPSEPELRSLVYKAGGLEAGRPGYCNPAIDQAAFPDTASDHYWTADVDEARGEAKWVNFFDGREHTDVVESQKHVRCVHDP